MSRVAVVGAGVTGLAAAWRLRRAGIEVTLLEAGPRPGGRIGSARFAGRLVDTGPDTLGPDPAMDELLAQLGMEGEVEFPDPPRAFRLVGRELEPFGVGGGAMFGLADGIFSLPERLCRELAAAGVEPRLASPASRVCAAGDLVEVVSEGGSESFDAVLLATGARAASRLLEGAAAERLAEVRGLSVTLVHLAVEAAAIGREMDGTGYLADPAPGRLVTGCSWSSAKWRRLAGDPFILRASSRESGAGELIGRPDDEVLAKVIDEVGPVMELAGEPSESLITRHPDALVVRDEQHRAVVAAARDAIAATPRIGLVGADLDGPGISRAIAGMRETVDAIIERITA